MSKDKGDENGNENVVDIAVANVAEQMPLPSSKTYYGRWRVPSRMDGGILRFINQGVLPGDFLQAVICNDLKNSVAKADADNMANLPAYVYYFYNDAPASCWGSEAKMRKWSEQGGLNGIAKSNTKSTRA